MHVIFEPGGGQPVHIREGHDDQEHAERVEAVFAVDQQDVAGEERHVDELGLRVLDEHLCHAGLPCAPSL